MSIRHCFGALLLAGLLFSLTSCGNDGLALIEIVPSGAVSMTVGQEVQFTAWGLYGNANRIQHNKNITDSVTWGYTTSVLVPCPVTPAVPGCFMAVSPGVAVVGASAPGFTGTIWSKENATITVTACTTGCTTTSTEPVTALTITPSTDSLAQVGQTAQFVAIATTNSGLQVDVTNLTATNGINGYIAWGSTNAGVATVCNAGLPNGCTSSTNGLATATGQGTTPITAIWTNPDGTEISGSASLAVTGVATEPLQSLALTPGTQSIVQGQSSQLIAIGTFSATAKTPGTQNLTNSKTVTWYSSNSSIASVIKTSVTNCGTASVANCGGYVTANSAGTAVITAVASDNTDGSLVTATATVTVTASTTGSSEPLVSLAIVPATQTSLAIGASANVNFIAIGTTGAGTTVQLTNAVQTVNGQTINPVSWYSSNQSVASFASSAVGTATPKSAGATAITAIVTNPDKTVVTGSAAYTVTVSTSTEPYVSLAILPASQTLNAAGQQAKFIAIGTTGSGATVDLTSLASWSSSDANGKIVTNAGKGVFSAVANGAVAITATFNNSLANGNASDLTSVIASAALTATTTATPEPLLSVAVVPSSQSVASPGQSSQLLAIGTFSAVPITQDVTAGIASEKITTSWSSSNTAVATVTTSCPTGLTALSCTLSACPGSSSGTTCTSCPAGTVAAGSSCATLNPTTPPGLVTGVNKGTAAIVVVAANSDQSLVTNTAPFTVVGGTTEQYTALQIIPSTLGATAPAQQNQLIALGTDGSTGLQYDVTSLVVWNSGTSAVASICSAVADAVTPISCKATPGLVTAATAGTTNITATWTNPDKSKIVTQATYTVTIGASPEPLISINVVPASTIVSNKGMTQQYLAFGTYTTIPTLRDITDSVSWITLEPDLVSINSTGTAGEPAGLATAMGETGLGVLYAEGTNPDKTLVLSNAVTFTCKDPAGVCDPTVAPALLATLTVFNAGDNSTNWLITAPSDQNVPNLIHCGPGSELAGLGNSVCTGTYAAGTNVTITASLAGKALDTTFGGWTANCDLTVDVPDMSATCALPTPAAGGNPSGLVGDQSVGALFYGLSLSCPAVTSGKVGVAFNSGAMTASGGTAPYTFSVVGTLPAGLTLNTSTGAVTGTPTAAGSFSINGTDANGTTAATACAITIQ